MKDVKISVAICVSKNAENLADAINSVVGQTITPEELLVIDPNQDAFQRSRVESISAQSVMPIRYLHKPGTPANALNTSVQSCESDFVLFLDPSAMLLPEAIEQHFNTLYRNPEADIIYGQVVECDENFDRIGLAPTADLNTESRLYHTFTKFPVRSTGTMVKRSCFDKVGPFQDRFVDPHHFEFYARAASLPTVVFAMNHSEVAFEIRKSLCDTPKDELQARVVVLEELLSRHRIEDIFSLFENPAKPTAALYKSCAEIANIFASFGGFETATEALSFIRGDEYRSEIGFKISLLKAMRAEGIDGLLSLREDAQFYAPESAALLDSLVDLLVPESQQRELKASFLEGRLVKFPLDKIYAQLDWQNDPNGATLSALVQASKDLARQRSFGGIVRLLHQYASADSETLIDFLENMLKDYQLDGYEKIFTHSESPFFQDAITQAIVETLAPTARELRNSPAVNQQQEAQEDPADTLYQEMETHQAGQHQEVETHQAGQHQEIETHQAGQHQEIETHQAGQHQEIETHQAGNQYLEGVNEVGEETDQWDDTEQDLVESLPQYEASHEINDGTLLSEIDHTETVSANEHLTEIFQMDMSIAAEETGLEDTTPVESTEKEPHELLDDLSVLTESVAKEIISSESTVLESAVSESTISYSVEDELPTDLAELTSENIHQEQSTIIERPDLLALSSPLLAEAAEVIAGDGEIDVTKGGAQNHKKLAISLSPSDALGEVKISVIIPTLNRPHLLLEAVESVCQQPGGPFEIIIVNDAGNAIPKEILEKFMSKSVPITVVSHRENLGVGASRNTGASGARGDWLYFLDDDDTLVPGGPYLLWEVADKQEIPFVFGDHIQQDFRQSATPSQSYRRVRGSAFELLDIENRITAGSFIIRKDLFNAINGYREDLEVAVDYNLQIRVASTSPITHVPSPVVIRNERNNIKRMGFEFQPYLFASSALNHELFRTKFPNDVELKLRQRKARYAYLQQSIEAGLDNAQAAALVFLWWDALHKYGLEYEIEFEHAIVEEYCKDILKELVQYSPLEEEGTLLKPKERTEVLSAPIN